MAATKTARLNLRLNEDDDTLLRRAADATGQTLSEFMTDSALARAHDVLADQRHFTLDEEAWSRFLAIIDTPAEPDPALVELLSRPRRIGR